MKIFRGEGFYIIKLNGIFDDKIFQNAINDILIMRGIKERVGTAYGTYFTDDFAFCVVDFNHKRLTDGDVEEIVRPLRDNKVGEKSYELTKALV